MNSFNPIQPGGWGGGGALCQNGLQQANETSDF